MGNQSDLGQAQDRLNLEPDLLAGEGGWVANHLRVGQSEVNGTMCQCFLLYILICISLNNP